MADGTGTAERVAIQLAQVIGRIAGKLNDDEVLDTLEQLGVRFPEQLLTEPAITAARTTITTVAAQLGGLTKELTDAIDGGDTAAAAAASLALVTQIGRVTAAIPELAGALRSRGPTLPGITAAMVDELTTDLPRKLTDLLLAALLELAPGAAAILTVLGIVDRTFVAGDQGIPPNPALPPYEKVTVHLDRLLPAVTNPVKHLKTLYGWGAGAFDAVRLLTALEAALAGVGLPVLLIPPGPGTPPELQAFAVDIKPTADGTGLDLSLVLNASAAGGFDAPVSPPDWIAHIERSGTLSAGAHGTLRPPFDIELAPLTGALAGEATVRLTRAATEPFLLLGQNGGSRLEFATLGLEAAIRLALDTATGRFQAAPAASGEVTGGKLVIDLSGGDGFISTVAGGGRIEAGFGLGFAFTPESGLQFHGSGALEIALPVHVELGPARIQTIYLAARPAGGTVPVELSAGLSARLGPISAAVDRIGFVADLGFPDGGGNLGPANVTFAFKPPNGVGLAIKSGLVTGGGYLFADPDRGEYAGALELEFADFLALKAIGLITTRMPDGSAGFSLLLVITAEFPGGLQLGYGFKLLGVGGVIGLNRGMRLDAIMEGVRTGAIESVMFPHDVVANAPRILSDLKAFFPPQDDVFLIGPMAKLGWGTPTLVSVSLGIIIEIPGNIALLGVLQVALPAEDQAILLLQVNFAGAIEFDKKRIYFFAALYHSRILTITIEGELGLLVAYGDQPDFVLTVGGFHPAYKVPPLPFPVPKRISINLLNSDAGRLGVDGYFAITSNTAQFGAHAELFLGLGAFSVQGHLGFDALFQFSPFSFVIEISAGVSVKVFGVGMFSVSLDFTLSGPTPWEARGSASISLLFFSIGVDFDITWGEIRDILLPPISVLPLLTGELDKPESWRVHNPAGGAPLVTLRALPSNETDVVLHPLGTVVVQQRAVPLDIRIDKVGNEAAVDVSSAHVEVDSGGLVKLTDAGDMFALAQFQNLSDAEKLSLPSFERQNAGVELAPDGTATTSARAVRRSARYEQVVIDDRARTPNSFVSYNTALFQHFMAGAGVARSALSRAEKVLRQPFTEGVAVTGDTYVVAATRDNTAQSLVFGSHARARAHLDTMLAADPNLIDTLYVIPATEVAR